GRSRQLQLLSPLAQRAALAVRGTLVAPAPALGRVGMRAWPLLSVKLGGVVVKGPSGDNPTLRLQRESAVLFRKRAPGEVWAAVTTIKRGREKLDEGTDR